MFMVKKNTYLPSTPAQHPSSLPRANARSWVVAQLQQRLTTPPCARGAAMRVPLASPCLSHSCPGPMHQRGGVIPYLPHHTGSPRHRSIPPWCACPKVGQAYKGPALTPESLPSIPKRSRRHPCPSCIASIAAILELWATATDLHGHVFSVSKDPSTTFVARWGSPGTYLVLSLAPTCSHTLAEAPPLVPRRPSARPALPGIPLSQLTRASDSPSHAHHTGAINTTSRAQPRYRGGHGHHGHGAVVRPALPRRARCAPDQASRSTVDRWTTPSTPGPRHHP